MPDDTTPAAAAEAPASSPTPEAPASTPATEAPASTKDSGDFVSEALKQLSPHQEGAPAPAKEEAPAPTPAKEEAPAAPTNTEDEEGKRAEEDVKRETASMPPQQKAAFTKLRYELRDKNRQLKAAMEAQQDQGGEKTADPELTAEVERLRSENAKAQERLAQFDEEFFATRVELTDEFRSRVIGPRDEVAKAIGEISDRYEGYAPEEVVTAVRSADPRQVAKVTADMNEFDRYRFYQLVDRYQDITKTERAMRADAKGTLERLETDRRSKTEAQTAKEREEWKGALDRTWEKLTEDFPVLAPIEGADDWNQQIEKVKNFAAPDRFGKLTTQEKAETLYRAAAFPALVAELEAARSSLEEAQGKLGKFQGATPSVATAGGSDPTTPRDADLVTEMSRMFRQAGLG
jgi:hypothetical protein